MMKCLFEFLPKWTIILLLAKKVKIAYFLFEGLAGIRKDESIQLY